MLDETFEFACLHLHQAPERSRILDAPEASFQVRSLRSK